MSAASKLLEPELPVSSTDDVYDRSDRLAQNAPHITPVGNYLVNGSIVTLFTASGATHNGTDLGSDEHSAGSGNTPATVSISIRKRPTDDIAAVMPSTVFTGSTEAKDPMQPSKELSHPLRRLIEEKEAERQRLARDLHDGVNQLIVGAQLRLHRAEKMIPASTPAVREVLARCSEMLARALDENHRIVRNLRPADLEELGLPTACRKFCEEVASRANLSIKCRIARSASGWNQEIQLNLFRIVQEALYNTRKYGSAKNVEISLTVRNGWVLLNIQDDGRGFRVRELTSGKRRRQGVGLSSMRERAELLGGTCEIQSAPGKGTRITVRLPWRQGEQD